MNKVIEANFLPRENDAGFFSANPNSISEVKEKRRILIVDDDKNATHLIKVLLDKARSYLVRRERSYQRVSERPEFSAGPHPD
jgi:PleD family two-component response regulator